MSTIYGVLDSNFYTEEHSLNNYVYFSSTPEKAQAFVLKQFGLEVEVGVPTVYGDDDDEYGERYVLVEKINAE